MITIKDSIVRQYGFTLRKTSHPENIQQIDYEHHMQRFVEKGLCIVVSMCFENTAGLHAHGIIEVSKALDLRRFRIRGWKMYLEEIYDQLGWLMYTIKDQAPKERIEDSNLSKAQLQNLRNKMMMSA